MHRLCGAVAIIMGASFACASPVLGAFTHPAVTVRGANVDFYAGHLVLDARGGATLDDGVVHVSADRIILDLTHDRFVAAGDVRITNATSSAASSFSGAALGVDLQSHAGTLIGLDPSPATFLLNGASLTPGKTGAPSGTPTPSPTASPAASSLTPYANASPSPSPSGSPAAASPSPWAGSLPSPSPTPSPSATPTPQPLSLVDLEGEQPFATASMATAHLGADVRLSSARVIVPGGKDVYLPSYVYTYSSDVGYSQSNVSGSSEDVPIFFGSTRDSVSGAHFTYNAVTKVGFGLDHRIVDGQRAYDLFSISPLNGPYKNAAFTWYEQINQHAAQSLVGASASGSGSSWNYNATDSLHRSYVALSSSDFRFGNFESLSWQGAYEPLGSGWLGDLFRFHVATGYGRSQFYSSGAAPIYDTKYEALVQAPALELDPSSSLSLQADWFQTFDDQPHRQFASTYSATLQHRWNRYLSTQLSDAETPIVDYYPSFGAGTRLYESRQVGSLDYGNAQAFALRLDVTHQAASSVPSGIAVQPWSAAADVRFRVSSSLAFDITRSYGFGYNGIRFGGLGFQIFP